MRLFQRHHVFHPSLSLWPFCSLHLDLFAPLLTPASSKSHSLSARVAKSHCALCFIRYVANIHRLKYSSKNLNHQSKPHNLHFVFDTTVTLKQGQSSKLDWQCKTQATYIEKHHAQCDFATPVCIQGRHLKCSWLVKCLGLSKTLTLAFSYTVNWWLSNFAWCYYSSSFTYSYHFQWPGS